MVLTHDPIDKEKEKWMEEFNENWKRAFLPFVGEEIEDILPPHNLDAFKGRIFSAYMKNPFIFNRHEHGYGPVFQQEEIASLRAALGIYEDTIIRTGEYAVARSYGVLEGNSRLYCIEGGALLLLRYESANYTSVTIKDATESEMDVIKDALKEIRIWESQR